MTAAGSKPARSRCDADQFDEEDDVRILAADARGTAPHQRLRPSTSSFTRSTRVPGGICAVERASPTSIGSDAVLSGRAKSELIGPCSATWKVAAPSASASAISRTSLRLANPLRASVRRRLDASRGTGSKQRTRPSGPTAAAMISASRPMLAPTSTANPPGRSSRARRALTPGSTASKPWRSRKVTRPCSTLGITTSNSPATSRRSRPGADGDPLAPAHAEIAPELCDVMHQVAVEERSLLSQGAFGTTRAVTSSSSASARSRASSRASSVRA